MVSIKDILDRLPQADRDLLDYAFEHEIPQFVRLPDNRFIGVNVDHLSYLKPDMVAGVWRAGRDESLAKDAK